MSQIIPKSLPTMVLAMVQMLMGIFFSIIIISIGISRLGEDLEKRHIDQVRGQQIDPSERDKGLSLRTRYDNLVAKRVCCSWHSLTHNSRVIRLRRQLRRFLLPIVMAIQSTKMALEWITADTSFARHNSVLHSLLFVLFDAINVAAVISTSLKFIRLGHMTELRLSFLSQSYLSSMLIFCGVFVDLQLSKNGDNIDGLNAFVTNETQFIGMWSKFLYFSFAMMTLCGAGLDVKPRTSVACIAVCFEMLLGLFFHVYIFGIGLLLLANNKFNANKQDVVDVGWLRGRLGAVRCTDRAADTDHPHSAARDASFCP